LQFVNRTAETNDHIDFKDNLRSKAYESVRKSSQVIIINFNHTSTMSSTKEVSTKTTQVKEQINEPSQEDKKSK
jgi:hypothetical protein